MWLRAMLGSCSPSLWMIGFHTKAPWGVAHATWDGRDGIVTKATRRCKGDCSFQYPMDAPLEVWTSMRGCVAQENEDKKKKVTLLQGTPHPSPKATLSTSNESLLASFGSSLVLLAHSEPHTLVRSVRRVQGGYGPYLRAGCVSHWHWSLVKGNEYLNFRWNLKSIIPREIKTSSLTQFYVYV